MSETTLQSTAFIVSPSQMALDTAMLEYDVWGTRAHVLMLSETGIIPVEAAAVICRALSDIEKSIREGAFKIDPRKGAQLSLEAAVLEAAGVEDGSRMHTARSRNDQVMVAEMLYLRERVLALASETYDVVGALLNLAHQHIETVMPGYTHMQPAKPTTFGQWALAYADAMLRNLDDTSYTWAQYDACPLGAVESYGTCWPIDRALTARLLGFDRVWEVPQDVISSRGQPQLAYLDVCKRLALTMSKIAIDLLLFTTWEYGYIRLGEAVAQRLHPITGSSVMAQKKNPDVLELLRATGQEVISLSDTAAHVLAGLPMGYNRDSRQVKEWSALAFDKTLSALSALQSTLSTLDVNRERMLEAVKNNYSSTTDLADTIAQQTGVGYRRIYAIVGRLVDTMIEQGRPLHAITAQEIVHAAADAGLSISLTNEQVAEALDPGRALSRRKHIGGAAPEEMTRMLKSRNNALSAHLEWIGAQRAHIAAARKETLVRVERLGKT